MQTNGVGLPTYTKHILLTYTKSYSKWTNDLNIRANQKLLRENIGANIHDLDLEYIFRYDTKSMNTKEKIDALEFIKNMTLQRK